ncbi:MAG: glycosyltransferase family 4 protein [Deltaproteobacteria bacterium]|nr:glycosyltransferase family 4 protein [Deltaproteobacteria bacterium]
MRILNALTYYRPHVSGLTIYAERLARGLARRGHTVTVLTSQFHPSLAPREVVDGIEVVRVPVARKLSKGVIMPLFPVYAAAQIARHDALIIHVPQLEAAGLALLGRLAGRRVVLKYHCDLTLPHGLLNRIVQGSLGPLNHIAASLAHHIVASSDDYARHSALLRRYNAKVTAITPLIATPAVDPQRTRALAQSWGLTGRPCIGFAARFAAEKGVEFLLRALPQVLAQIPEVCVVFTGACKDTVGEEAYLERLRPMLQQYADHLVFLDLLRDDEMPSFFAACNVLAVTSLNSTEAFGMSQAEAMLAGTPAVATDLPGVREPVRRTGMGEIVAPHDPEALAQALVRIIRQRPQYERPHTEVLRCFDPEVSIDQYERLCAGK